MTQPDCKPRYKGPPSNSSVFLGADGEYDMWLFNNLVHGSQLWIIWGPHETLDRSTKLFFEISHLMVERALGNPRPYDATHSIWIKAYHLANRMRFEKQQARIKEP